MWISYFIKKLIIWIMNFKWMITAVGFQYALNWMNALNSRHCTWWFIYLQNVILIRFYVLISFAVELRWVMEKSCIVLLLTINGGATIKQSLVLMPEAFSFSTIKLRFYDSLIHFYQHIRERTSAFLLLISIFSLLSFNRVFCSICVA